MEGPITASATLSPSSPTRWPDVSSAGGPRSRPLSAAPWQFLVRAVAVITGLTMLLIVDVRGAAFYFAWALIVLALATEALGTFVYWRRSRANRGH
jgi:hypothetical protein